MPVILCWLHLQLSPTKKLLEGKPSTFKDLPIHSYPLPFNLSWQLSLLQEWLQIWIVSRTSKKEDKQECMNSFCQQKVSYCHEIQFCKEFKKVSRKHHAIFFFSQGMAMKMMVLCALRLKKSLMEKNYSLKKWLTSL